MRDRWPIFLFVVLFQTSFSALNTMLLPFLRSGVQCEVRRPGLSDKRLKRVVRLGGSDAESHPHSRADWTGSTMCQDKSTVLATSQRYDGWCTSLRVLVHMASTPLLGALADRHGRVRIVVLSVAFVTACALAFALTAASTSRAEPAEALRGELRLPLLPLLCGYVLLGCSAVQPPLNAALSDRTPPEERGAAFSVLGVCHAAAGGAGTLLSIVLLRLDLEDYALFWLLIALAVPLLALPLAPLGPPHAQAHGGGNSYRSVAERETTAFLDDKAADELLPRFPPSPAPLRLAERPSAELSELESSEEEAAATIVAARESPRTTARARSPDTSADAPHRAGSPRGGARRGGKGPEAGGGPHAAGGVRWAYGELSQAAAGLCELLRGSPFLRRLSAGTFLLMWGAAGGLSILNNFTLAVYNWQQGDLQVRWMASLPGALLSLGLANCCLFARYGAPFVYCLALIALCCGFGLLVFAPFSPVALTVFLLLCGFATVGFAAMLTIIAQRFDPSEQARAQSLLVFSSTLSRSTAAPSFAYIFDPRDRGVAAARPFVLALCFVVAGACVLCTAVLQGPRGGLGRVPSETRLARMDREAPVASTPPKGAARSQQ